MENPMVETVSEIASMACSEASAAVRALVRAAGNEVYQGS